MMEVPERDVQGAVGRDPAADHDAAPGERRAVRLRLRRRAWARRSRRSRGISAISTTPAWCEDRREGLWMHYRISPDLAPEQRIIVAALSEAVGEEQKQELRQALDRWFAEKTAAGATQEQGAASCCWSSACDDPH